MKNKLIDGMEKTSNVTRNAKGAKSNKSTLNACVDLFGSLGSMRARSDKEVISMFTKAFGEDKLTAMKLLFFVRDVRGGMGERKVPRTIFKYLAEAHTESLRKNLHLFAEYGRWDDLFSLEGTPVWDDTVDMILNQLQADVDSDKPSLLGKWMPSINTSSDESRRLARYFAQELGWSEKAYRKTLAALRKQIKVVERDMCANNWNEINYEHVPSRASMIYRNAFQKHDGDRYTNFLNKVEKGEASIKTATLYPYDLLRKILNYGNTLNSYDKTVALQWDNLPNYVEPFNGMVICDTSGSMSSSGYYGVPNSAVRPIDVAVSLAIYIAERNEGQWKNRYINFNTNARFKKVQGSNIYEKVSNMDFHDWGGSTNLQSAFDLILNTAVKNDVPASDMPKTLFVVSDMQFDTACMSNKRSNFEQIEKKYRKAGYERPNLVFWNVNAYGKDQPITVDDSGTAIVSGCSPANLKSVLANEVITPEDVMRQAIETERYEPVTV